MQVGSGQLLRVAARGGLIFYLYQINAAGVRDDLQVRLTNVSAVEGLNLNLRPLHELSIDMLITTGVKVVHLPPLCYVFPRNQSVSYLLATTRVSVSALPTSG